MSQGVLVTLEVTSDSKEVGAGKTWCASTANSGLVQIPDNRVIRVGVDMVRQRQGLGVFGFSATAGMEICV